MAAAVQTQPRHHAHRQIGGSRFSCPDLKKEYNRLRSFAPVVSTGCMSLSLVQLAANGFVYEGDGHSDTVRCIFCKAVKSHWRGDEDVAAVHAQLNSTCPMVTKGPSENVDQAISGAEGTIKFYKKLYRSHDRRSKKHLQHLQTLTQASSPHSSASSPSLSLDQVDGTQSYAAPDKQETGVGHGSNSENELSQTIHQLLQPGLAGSVKVLVQESDQQAPSQIVTNRSYLQSTMSTHSPESTQSSKPSANSSSSGIATNGSVDSHDSKDMQHSNTTAADSVQAHVNSSSSTTGTGSGSNRGHRNDEVDAVQQAPQTAQAPRRKQPSFEELCIITAKPKRSEYATKQARFNSFNAWPEEHHLRPNVLADAGFFHTGVSDTTRCFYCGGGLRNWDPTDDAWVEHVRWFPKCSYMKMVKGKEFVQAVLELSKTQEQISYNDVMDTLDQTDGADGPLMNDAAVKAVTQCGFDLSDVLEVAKRMTSESAAFNCLKSDQLYDTLVQKMTNKGQPVPHSTNRRQTNDHEALESLRESISSLHQQRLCKICLDNEVQVVFLPCGHFVSCVECANAFKECPICRVDVKGIVRIDTSLY